MNIKMTDESDIPALQTVLDETGLFPSELLPDMLDDSEGEEDTGEAIWLTALDDNTPTGFCYTIPEPMTDGTWNMIAIAVLPARQGSGQGTALVAHVEDMLRERGARLLIVDTSSTEAFARTRRFHARLGYDEEARIRDFWDAGDDKVTFRKAL